LTNFSSLPRQAQASHFESISSLRKYFRAWYRQIQANKENSDSEAEEEDGDFFEEPSLTPFSNKSIK
jgi:hypothetical protein